MTWNVVQSVSGTSSVSTGTTFTVTYGSNVSAGNKLIAFITVSPGVLGSITSVQDAALNSMTQCGDVQGTTGGNVETAIYAMDVPAGDVGTKPAIKITYSQTADFGMVLQEVSGLAVGNTTAAMLDGTAATSQITPTTSQAQPAYTSTALNEYLVSLLGDNGNGVTWALSGYTLDANSVQGSATDDVVVGYKNSTNGAESGTWTTAGTPTGSGLVVVAFKLGAAGAPAPQPQPGGPAWRRRFRRPQVRYWPLGPSAAAPPPPPTQQITVPRRRPARAVWRGGQGQAYVAVPAPAQQPPVPRRKPARAVWRGSAPFLGYVAVPPPIRQPAPAPRRKPARAVWRGGQGQAYVAVPAPAQQPAPAPRRRPARAVIEFTPVATTNAAAAAIAGTVQPWPTVPVPRRRPVRGVWHGGAGQAYMFVPAPVQQPRAIPRRRPARSVSRGGAGQAYVAVAAPRQQPAPAPRRRLVRAYVQFSPVRTTNGGVVVTVARVVPVGDYDGKTWWKKRWILRL